MLRDTQRAQRVIDFIQKLKITIGKDAGKPFILRPWQQAFIRDVYEPQAEDGRRLVRRAVFSLPRKLGKTELAAALILVHFIGPESELNGEIYSAANDREQASIVFNAVRRMVEETPALQQHITIVQSTNLSYSRRSVSGPLWAFAAAGCIARTTGIAGVCFTAFGLMGFSG